MEKNSRSKSSTESNECERAKSQDGDVRGDSEFLTIAFVREMIKVQESSFKSMFESLLSSLTNRVDNPLPRQLLA